MRQKLLVSLATIITVIMLTAQPLLAEQFLLDGKPVNVMGYITQGSAVSLIDKNKHDTERDFQSALMNVFLEGDYKPLNDLKFYVSGMFTADWIYDVKSQESAWKDKLFDQSRKTGLYMDNEYWQLLKEAHVSWTPPGFLFRVGKQVVSWGETDGFRLMDQINPQDQRRGFADVEFENTIIPIWLARAEYNIPRKPSWLQDLGLEFVFNPNVSFIRNQGIGWGNDKGGIWAPKISGPDVKDIPGIGLFPTAALPMLPPPLQAFAAGLPTEATLTGSADMNIDKPRAFDTDGFEYAFRVKGIVADSVITFNYYYGRDKDPILKMGSAAPTLDRAPDGTPLVHYALDGHYPLFRFVGGTFSRDITPLKSEKIGGVAPVLRLETFYAFNNTFAKSDMSGFEHHDELRWAAGLDWKVKIDFLNPRAYFTISPQFYHQKILDFPANTKEIYGGALTPLRENNYTTTLLVSTSYLHNRLNPSFFWMNNRTTKSNFFRYQIVYDYTNEWHYTVGAMTFDGDKKDRGFEIFKNKDQIYFKISYKWG